MDVAATRRETREDGGDSVAGGKIGNPTLEVTSQRRLVSSSAGPGTDIGVVTLNRLPDISDRRYLCL
jgi:hypothetical protein